MNLVLVSTIHPSHRALLPAVTCLPAQTHHRGSRTTDKQNCTMVNRNQFSFLHQSKFTKFGQIMKLIFPNVLYSKWQFQEEGAWQKEEAAIITGGRPVAPRVQWEPCEPGQGTVTMAESNTFCGQDLSFFWRHQRNAGDTWRWQKPLMKHSGNHGENYTSTSHSASSVLKVLLAERNPPLCLSSGFPPQQTGGITETTCTEHLDLSLSMQVARVFLLC